MASTILKGVKRFYLEERRSLLSCHEALIQDMVRPGGHSLLSPKLYETHIPENLAKSLLRSQTSEQREFRRFFDSDNSQESREKLAIAVQTEQIDIL